MTGVTGPFRQGWDIMPGEMGLNLSGGVTADRHYPGFVETGD